MKTQGYCYIKERSSLSADCTAIEPGADRILGRCTGKYGACYVSVSPPLLPKLPGIFETNYVVLLSHLRNITRADRVGNVSRKRTIVLSTRRVHFWLTALLRIYLCLALRLTPHQTRRTSRFEDGVMRNSENVISL